jgi:hypothetical protein
MLLSILPNLLILYKWQRSILFGIVTPGHFNLMTKKTTDVKAKKSQWKRQESLGLLSPPRYNVSIGLLAVDVRETSEISGNRVEPKP